MARKRVSLQGKGAELFFGDYTPANQPPPDQAAVAAEDSAPTPVEAPTPPRPNGAVAVPSPIAARSSGRPPRQAPRRQQPAAGSPTADNRASERASKLADDGAETIAAIRKVVKTLGKEVSFVRLTPEEKAQLTDIVYAYKRQGQKTTENEINRIAINFLLFDYHQNGEQSVLARALAALRA
jgi:hypothetical protein